MSYLCVSTFKMTKKGLVDDKGGKNGDEGETGRQELQEGTPSSLATTTISESSTFYVDLKSTDEKAEIETRLEAMEDSSTVALDTKAKSNQGKGNLAIACSHNQCDTIYQEEPISRFVSYPTSNIVICQRCESKTDSSSECRCRSSVDSRSLQWNLLYSSRHLLKLKDFRSEVRASMDVEQFVHQSELMLDLNEVSVEEIVRAMLQKVSKCCILMFTSTLLENVIDSTTVSIWPTKLSIYSSSSNTHRLFQTKKFWLAPVRQYLFRDHVSTWWCTWQYIRAVQLSSVAM